jgi:hypothetical protein
MLKTVSSITNAIGALNYKGTWDANANSPALASSVGTKGDYYVVGTAGSTNLNGISNWGVGDWAAYNGSVWQRVEGGANLNGVDLSVSGTSTLSGLTASTALALNASKEVISVTNTGTGNNVLSNSPTLLSPQITTTTTGSGAIISTLNGTAGNNTVNSTTYNVTFANSAKVFSVSLGSGDAVLCIANYASSVITILGTTAIIVNSSTPLSNQFGIYKSTNDHVVSFVTGSAATSSYGGWQIICLTSQAS